ncbi:mobilization protein [Rhizobium calliandrae]|uniref:Mobilization protein n=1 Tax=Rhizobium calliandrae TaxID=1312182 RepID=A0ABT7KQL4_9HYPH|nr:mobilization protein [Rhizobium calliandrae]MDL2410905.1 mobilization protein [Rhizobium calliandrae]
MARKTIEQRIAELEARKKTLKARLGKQERLEDTRRKILLGALVLHRLEHGKDQFSHDLMGWLSRELPGFLSRDHDKALFTDILDAPISPNQNEPGMDAQS